MHPTSSKAQRAMRAGRAAFQTRLARTDAALAKRVSAAYRDVLKQLDSRLADLRSIAHEDGMTSVKFVQDASVIRLRDDLRTELKDLEATIKAEAQAAELAGIQQAQAVAAATLRAVGVEGSFNQPSIHAIRMLVNYVDSGPFKAAVDNFAAYHSDQVSQLILNGAARGKNPIAIAREITNYVDTFPRADALRMVRTVDIWSMRQGTATVFRANADVVRGWVWSASIGDPRTCESCVMMHGTEHDLSETLDDHHSGRCAMIPITPTWAELGFSDGTDPLPIETGIDWFNKQNDAQQQQILGPAKWLAWKDGAFELNQIPRTYSDDIYGPMRRASSLTELLGRDAARQYISKKVA